MNIITFELWILGQLVKMVMSLCSNFIFGDMVLLVPPWLSTYTQGISEGEKQQEPQYTDQVSHHEKGDFERCGLQSSRCVGVIKQCKWSSLCEICIGWAATDLAWQKGQLISADLPGLCDFVACLNCSQFVGSDKMFSINVNTQPLWTFLDCSYSFLATAH